MSSFVPSRAGKSDRSILGTATRFPSEFEQGHSILSHNSTKTDLMLWCTEAGFSSQSAGGTGFYVPYKTEEHSGVVFLDEFVDKSQLARKLQTILDADSIIHFEGFQGVERTIKSLEQFVATDLPLDDSTQNPINETRRDHRSKQDPSMAVAKNDLDMKEKSATNDSTNELKKAIRDKFKDKALWFAVEWNRDHQKLKTQIQADPRVQARNLSNSDFHRFVRCAYECHAQESSNIEWGDIIDFVMAKQGRTKI